MPRKPRAKTAPYTGPQPDPALRPTDPTPTNYKEVLRVRCPVCGMLPAIDCFSKGPYALEVKMQRFGGSLPSIEDPDPKKKGKRRGYMEYIPAELTADDGPFINYMISKLNATSESVRGFLLRLGGEEGPGEIPVVEDQPERQIKPKYESKAMRLNTIIDALQIDLGILMNLAKETSGVEEESLIEVIGEVEDQIQVLRKIEFPRAFG